MIYSDNAAIENALFYDVFYGGTTRDWDDITEKTALGDMLMGWFCQRVLSNDLLFPAKPEDRTDILYRTYALGAVLAGYTSPDKIQAVIDKAKKSLVAMFGGSGAGADKFVLDRCNTVCSYELTFMDSAKGCADSISAMALAYMYMSGIPRDNEHARALIEICYAWMYSFSKLGAEIKA